MFVLVAWHSASVTLARTQHDVEGVEDAAVVVAGAADRGGGPVSWGRSRPR